MTKNNQLTIRFGGDGNIKIETLTGFLEQYQQILYIINKELGYKPDDLVVEVSPPENGSFKIKLKPKYRTLILEKFGDFAAASLAGLVILYATTQSNNETLDDIRNILEEKQITDKDVQKNVYNVYQNTGAKQNIQQTFILVNNDENITDLIIENKNQKVINIEKSEFKKLIDVNNVTEEIEQKNTEKIKKEAILVIKTLHFEGQAKWGFIFRGYLIKASIKDKDFFETLKTESFRKGDTLKVILSWTKNFDEDLQTYLVDESTYIIEKVIIHKSKVDNQSKLKLE
ncbi:hypothetical protein [Polaribacter sp. 11A2H]|uniref:hypothetical protein n=1 Tax=Polaribacter sp. 11A2H TaxID=2687290 RepID=UPI001409B689|nr:hypothetical protein [Polaribacter sp. 11A2H]